MPSQSLVVENTEQVEDVSFLAILDTLTSRQKTALEAYAKTPKITAAIKAAGVTRKTWHLWRKIHPNFNEVATVIEESDIDDIEHKAKVMAKHGNEAMIKLVLQAHRGNYAPKAQNAAIATAVNINVQKFGG